MDAAEYDLMDRAEGAMWWYRALHARLLEAIPAGWVLDAGCGTGGLLRVLAARRPELMLVGLEWDPGAASRARGKSGAPVAAGSVNHLPFADGSFDAVVSADVLCHAAVDPHHALNELHRVLRPGGSAVLNLPAFGWLLSAHDHRVHNVRRFTAGEATGLLAAAGFTRIRSRYWNSLLLPLMIVQRKILARGDHVSDVAPFPPWLDAIFHRVTELERRLPIKMPAGGSVLVIAEKP